MTALTTLYHRFFRPTLLAPDRPGAAGSLETVRTGGALGRRVGVLPRAQCQFQYIPGNYRGRAARKALDLKIRYQTAHDNPGAYVRVGASGAAVWSWDKAALPAALQPAALGKDTPLVPESALHPPLDRGVRLMACLDGVEGQFWRDGQLVTARWWPKTPTAQEWQMFLRAARADASESGASVRPMRADWLDPPLIDQPVSLWLAETAPRRLGLVATVILAPLFSYQASQWLYASWQTARFENRIAERRRDAQPLLAARRDSLAAAREIERQAKLGDEALMLRAFMEALPTLTASNMGLERVQLSEADLTLYLSNAPKEGLPDFIRALEDLAAWQGVNAQPAAGGTIRVNANLTPFSAKLTLPDTQIAPSEPAEPAPSVESPTP